MGSICGTSAFETCWYLVLPFCCVSPWFWKFTFDGTYVDDVNLLFLLFVGDVFNEEWVRCTYVASHYEQIF